MSPVMDSFNLSKDDTNTNGQSVESSGEGEQVSANDYDPNLDVDGKEDEEKRVRAVVDTDIEQYSYMCDLKRTLDSAVCLLSMSKPSCN